MTKGAYAFIAAGAAVYFVASQTQVGWLYLFDSIIWSLLAISIFLPGWSLKSLKVEQQVSPPVGRQRELPLGGPLEDEVVEVKLKVSNKGRISRYFIKLVADCPFEQPETRRKAFLLRELKHESPTAFSYTAKCYHRGYYASSGIILQSAGLLGLFVRRRKFTLPLNLTVYPAYQRMESLPGTGEDWVEQGHSVKASTASEFYGSRDYRHGDQLKHIHWRNTARTGHFMVKEFERSGQASLAVAFDASHEFGTGRETTLEYSIKIAASLARLCADSDRRLDIIAGGTVLYDADWRTAMDYLARLEVAETPAGTAASAGLPSVSTVLREAGDRFTVVIAPAAGLSTGSGGGHIPALLRLVGEGWGVMVVLEGFAPDEEAEKASRGNGMEIVRCTRGDLVGAIERLGGFLNSGGASSERK